MNDIDDDSLSPLVPHCPNKKSTKTKKGREGKGREGKGREGKGREGKGKREEGGGRKEREGKGREGKGREGERIRKNKNSPRIFFPKSTPFTKYTPDAISSPFTFLLTTYS